MSNPKPLDISRFEGRSFAASLEQGLHRALESSAVITGDGLSLWVAQAEEANADQADLLAEVVRLRGVLATVAQKIGAAADCDGSDDEVFNTLHEAQALAEQEGGA